MGDTKKIIFLRHGESIANANGVFAGHLDVDLTERGRCQAILAALQIKHAPIDAIYSSPLKRAKHTAEYIAEHSGASLATYHDLIERKLGSLEGKPFHMPALALLEHAPHAIHAESLEVLHQRAQKVLNSIKNGKHDSVVLVSHGGFGRMLETVLHGRPWQQYGEAATIANATPVMFEM